MKFHLTMFASMVLAGSTAMTASNMAHAASMDTTSPAQVQAVQPAANVQASSTQSQTTTPSQPQAQTPAQPVVTAPSTSTTALQTDVQKWSYAIGVDMGSNFKSLDIAVDPNLIARGLQESMAGSKLLLNDDELRQSSMDFQKKLITSQEEHAKKQSQTNLEAGNAFLAQNKKQTGVIELPSGLQYKVIDKGNGPIPTKEDTVSVEYEGRLLDGKVFDSTEPNKPVTFKVVQVIPGWIEALTHMHEGATWEVVIPPQLAYGERGVGGPIGPNQTLIFKIRLVKVLKTTAKS